MRTPSISFKSLQAEIRDPGFLGDRGSWLGQPMHQEVPLLEVREQLTSQGGHGQHAADEQRQSHRDRRQRPPDQWLKYDDVHALEPRISGDSLLASLPRDSRIRHKAGVTVSATSIETSTASP